MINLAKKLDNMTEVEFSRFHNAIKSKTGNLEIRLLILEFGFSVEDEGGMRKLRAACEDSLVRREAKKDRDYAEKAKRYRKHVDDCLRKCGSKVRVIGNPSAIKVEGNGRYLVFTCPRCKNTQTIDLTRSESGVRSLNVNMALASKGTSDITMLEAAKLAASSNPAVSKHGAGIVSMPSALDEPPIVRLSQGITIGFEFGCDPKKCGFRHKIVEVMAT